MINRKKTLWGGVAGVIITAVCCFTPILVVGMTVAGMAAYIGLLDYVLFPLLAACLGLVVFSLATWEKSSHRR